MLTCKFQFSGSGLGDTAPPMSPGDAALLVCRPHHQYLDLTNGVQLLGREGWTGGKMHWVAGGISEVIFSAFGEGQNRRPEIDSYVLGVKNCA